MTIRTPIRPHQVELAPLLSQPQSPRLPCLASQRGLCLLHALRACPPCQPGRPSLLMALAPLVCLSILINSYTISHGAFMYPCAVSEENLERPQMHGWQHKLLLILCGHNTAGNTWLALTICMPRSVGASPQSGSSAGPSLPPRKAKPEEQSGASGARAPVSGAQSQTRQQGVAASTPQGNGLPNGTSPSAPSTTGNGPAQGPPVSSARTAGTVSSGGAGGNSSGGAYLSGTSPFLSVSKSYPETANLKHHCVQSVLAVTCSKSRNSLTQVHLRMTTTARLQRSAEM